MAKAIDTLIESIKRDIRRTQGEDMRDRLGEVEQFNRMQEYRKRLTQAKYHRDMEGIA